jgi:mono/diheme cytochrome c family protein
VKKLVCISLGLLSGCVANGPPVVTNKDVDLALMQRGRALFTQRCIECHTLPPVRRYSREEWPRLVDAMAPRASLRPNERDAIVAYILAAHDIPVERAR